MSTSGNQLTGDDMLDDGPRIAAFPSHITVKNFDYRSN